MYIAGKHVFNIMHTYLRETELVHALGDAPLCSPHVLRFFWSFEQQSLFILNSHTALKRKGEPLAQRTSVLKAINARLPTEEKKKKHPLEMPMLIS